MDKVKKMFGNNSFSICVIVDSCITYTLQNSGPLALLYHTPYQTMPPTISPSLAMLKQSRYAFVSHPTILLPRQSMKARINMSNGANS